LKSLTIEYPPVTPAGTWLFTGTPSEHSSDEEDSDDGEPDDDEKRRIGDHPWQKFRRTRVVDAMNDIYLAAGLAAMRMPLLERMELRAEIAARKAEHAFSFSGRVGGGLPVGKARWVEWPEKTWEPSQEVLDVRKEVVGETGSLVSEVD
jgi:hypothetical protein